jgi:hypothetical protein
MYLQEILEVAIGLVFVWLVVSIATMSLQEWLGNIINLRARDLEKVIIQMLSNKELARRFYEYPLIANLYNWSKRSGRKGHLPSYIPSAKFGATVFDLIVQAGTDNSPVRTFTTEIEDQLASIESPEQQKLAWDDWNAILETARNITASGFGTSALDSLKYQIQSFAEKYAEMRPVIAKLFPQVDAYYGQLVDKSGASAGSVGDGGLAMRQFNLGMLALQDSYPVLSESMKAVLRQTEVYGLQGEQAVATTRANLESWFNDAMDRLSEMYKRRAQFIAFVIGILLALFLNVDSIRVATSLWREPTLRQAIIAQAQAYSASNACPGSSSASGPLENIPALEKQLEALNIPFGWAISAFDTGGKQCSLLPIKPGQILGFPGLDEQQKLVCFGITNLPLGMNGWLVKVLGMILTGMAAAQGAPFWFDVFKKILGLRNTAANPVEKEPAS